MKSESETESVGERSMLAMPIEATMGTGKGSLADDAGEEEDEINAYAVLSGHYAQPFSDLTGSCGNWFFALKEPKCLGTMSLASKFLLLKERNVRSTLSEAV